MSAPSQAVFLSYASQDMEAARRICDTLRNGGVEVWFDADGGLEHGDEWDAKIRRQIKECVLFIPIISASTQARPEGYFRIEWELAAQRALGIASGVPFILPIVIDDTKEPDALVPDRFRMVQWTRLRGGEVPPEVLQRFLKLWSHRIGALNGVAPAASSATPIAVPTVQAPSRTRTWWPVALAAGATLAVGAWWFLRPARVPAGPSAASSPATVSAPTTEARDLARRAHALINTLDAGRDDYQLAEELIMKAQAKDNTDAEIWAVEAQVHQRINQRGWDTSDARRESARRATQRALRLDPQSFEARFAQAGLLGNAGREAEERERILRELRRERPTEQRVLRSLASLLGRMRRLDEAAAIAHESAALPGGDPLALYDLSQSYWFAGRAADAETAIEAALAQKTFTGALLLNVWYKTSLRGDITRARELLNRTNPAEMTEDRAAYFGYYTEYLGRSPDKAIAWLRAVPRDWLNDAWYRGPKALLIGNAYQLAGRSDAARIEWQSALKLIDQKLTEENRNLSLLRRRVELLARLGQGEEATRQLALLSEVAGPESERTAGLTAGISLCNALVGQKADAIRQIATFVRTSANWQVTFSSAALRLDPDYDTLRGEPAFEALIAEIAARERDITSTDGKQSSLGTANAPAIARRSAHGTGSAKSPAP